MFLSVNRIKTVHRFRSSANNNADASPKRHRPLFPVDCKISLEPYSER